MKRKQLPGPVRLRPLPPASLTEPLFGMGFLPAPEVLSFVTDTFLPETGELYNPDHQHLTGASIGFLWASAGYNKSGRHVLGQTEDLRLAMRGNGWQRGRAEQQLAGWFPSIPDFLITLDGEYCQHCTEAEFCALVEHELYQPRFYKESGLPVLAIRGHDVEEFVGVVRRYGVGRADGPLAQLIIAAAKKPELVPVSIARACGTCLIRAA